MYTLMLWTIIAAGGASNFAGREYRDWRPIVTEIRNEKLCQEAIQTLGIDPKNARCVRTAS